MEGLQSYDDVEKFLNISMVDVGRKTVVGLAHLIYNTTNGHLVYDHDDWVYYTWVEWETDDYGLNVKVITTLKEQTLSFPANSGEVAI